MDTQDVRENPAEKSQTCAELGCRQRLGLMYGSDGQKRCAQHDPDRKEARDERMRKTRARERGTDRNRGVTAEPDELPVASIDDLDDALKLARWVPVAIATGRLGRGEAMATVAALREFRMTYADAEMAKRVEELERRIASAKARGMDV